MTTDSAGKIYFDNAAATPVSTHLLKFFNDCVGRYYANQEAIHHDAFKIRQTLKQKEAELLEYLCGKNHDAQVLWSDSGTTAINTILLHPVFQQQEIITTNAEHSGLSAALSRVSDQIKTVNLNKGIIDLEHLEKLLTPQTTLVAVHHVQSETGALQDLSAIRKIIDSKAPQAMLLVDTIQSACKHPLPWHEAKIDFAFVSGYKIGAPGGAAAIYRKRQTATGNISEFYNSLRKEKHLSSRPNPALSMTMTQAVIDMTGKMDAHLQHIKNLNNYLRRRLSETFGDKIIFAVPEKKTSPYILHFLMPGFQGAVLVRMLSAENIIIASGSACNAETKTPSPALLASGVTAQDAFAGIRLSFSPHNTLAEAETLIKALNNIVSNY